MRVNTLISGAAIAVVTILAVIATVQDQVRPATDKPIIEEAPEMEQGRGPLAASSNDPLLAREPLSLSLLPDPDLVSAEEADDIRFCFTAILPHKRCATRADILAMDERPIDRLTADGSPRLVSVMLSHPTDYLQPDQDVRTCIVYAGLRAEGWQPLTQVAILAASHFERYCGLKGLASVAQIPRTTRFDQIGLKKAVLDSVPASHWPGFEDLPDSAPIISADESDTGSWMGNSETMIYRISDVAHADFDDDGEGERLLHIGLRARGGSFGYAQYFLLEHDSAGIGLRPVVWE